MNYFLKLVALTTVIVSFSQPLNAQRQNVNVSQVDPRFTVSVQRYWSSLGGSEEYWYYVQNNTPQEYELVIDVTIDLACVGTKRYTLGYNKVVYLKPNGRFKGEDDDNVHILTSGSDNFKNCRLKDGNSFTLYQGLTYRISKITNLTQEKDAKEKKKKEEELARQQKLEADKKKKEEQAKADADKKKKEEQAKADTDKKKKEEQAKTDADKKKKDEQAKKDAESKTSNNKTAGSSTGSKGTGAGKATATSSTAEKSSSSAGKVNAKSASEKNREEAQAKAAEKEQARLAHQQKEKEEQEKRAQKQADYDKWKADEQNKRSTQDAASVGALAIVMVALGEWIYNDKMGVYNPAFAYDNATNKAQFGLGIDYGYSLVSTPIMFASDFSTMTGGSTVSKKELTSKNPLYLNFDLTVKMGAEHKNYGGYGYLNPKVGVSPVFDGSYLSLQYGARVFAGVRWAKAYFDYGSGSRTAVKSSTDVEENGKGKQDVSFDKMEYGIRFTTNPNADLKRSHISLGVITEKMKMEKPFGYINPETGSLVSSGVVGKFETPSISGYSFQWDKEHTFKLYLKYYPEYIYAGEVPTGYGATSSDLKSSKTGSLIEFGFVRSVNWW
jgi:hypothetical protein